MPQQILTIARQTLQQAIRQPIYMILLLVGAGCLILLPSLSAYTFDDDNKFLIEMGLSTMYLTGLALAAFTATGVVSDEIENRTVLTVISKPVSRPLFVIGKFLGVAAAAAIAMWTLSLVLFLAIRHGVMATASDKPDWPVLGLAALAVLIALVGSALANYLYQWVFPSTFSLALTIGVTIVATLILFISPEGVFQNPTTEFTRQGAMAGGQLPLGMLLVFQAVLFLTAVAVAASTRAGQVVTLLICVGVFALGMTSDALLLGVIDESWSAHLIYLLLPNLQFLWSGQALSQGHDVSMSYLGLVSAYASLQTLAVLALAVALFQSREVG